MSSGGGSDGGGSSCILDDVEVLEDIFDDNIEYSSEIGSVDKVIFEVTSHVK